MTQPADSPRVHDHTDGFFRFARGAPFSDDASMVAAFRDAVVPEFPDYYAARIARWTDRGRDADAEIAAQLRSSIPLVPTMERVASSLRTALPRDLESFRREFPDVAPVDVHVVHSLGELDGGVRVLSSGTKFVLGLDVLARRDDPPLGSPFFHHEFFHVYHIQHFDPYAPANMPDDAVHVALWMEGLATYVSAVLNPAAGPRELFLDQPPGTWAKYEASRSRLAAQVLADLRSTDPRVYEQYFKLDACHDPPRSGYYLGYLAVAAIARGRRLRELAAMQVPQYLPPVEDELRRIARGQRPAAP